MALILVLIQAIQGKGRIFIGHFHPLGQSGLNRAQRIKQGRCVGHQPFGIVLPGHMPEILHTHMGAGIGGSSFGIKANDGGM